MIYPIIIILMLFCGCSQENKLVEHIIEIPDNNKEILLSSFCESANIIRLETNKDCLIANIDKILPYKEKLYILDRVSNAIFVFEQSGKYDKTLFKVGNGPGEYVQLMDMDIADDKLFLLDFARQHVMIYDTDNLDYIDKFRFSSYASQITCTKDGFLLYNEPSGNKGSYYFSALDKNGIYIKGIIPRSNLNPSFNYGGIPVFSKCQNELYYSPIYSNYIYSNTVMMNKYVIQFENHSFPNDESIENYDLSSTNYIVKDFFFATPKYLIIGYEKEKERQIALFDIKQNKVYSGKANNDLFDNFRFFPQWSNGNYLIEFINAEILANGFPHMLNYKKLHGLKEDDNPVVILYKLKEK